MESLTYEEAKALLDYNPQDGSFIWRVCYGRARSGSPAGSDKYRDGRLRITIRRHHYLAYRLAWLIIHGVWPTSEIDHISGDHRDNRIANLREANRSQNMRNTGISARNSSGIKGVCYVRRCKLWQAHITHNGLCRHLGYFGTKEDAARARRDSEIRLHGEFSRAA